MAARAAIRGLLLCDITARPLGVTLTVSAHGASGQAVALGVGNGILEQHRPIGAIPAQSRKIRLENEHAK